MILLNILCYFILWASGCTVDGTIIASQHNIYVGGKIGIRSELNNAVKGMKFDF